MTQKRLVVLDTETTGTNVAVDRIVSFGVVAIEHGKITFEYERFYNPGVSVPPEATQIHGITNEFLSDKPLIGSGGLLEIIGLLTGADVVGHNVSYDLGILDAEMVRHGLPKVSSIISSVTDTLQLSKARFPGQKHNLDALCNRLKVPLAKRKKHGALVDAILCANCYLYLNVQQSSMFDEPAAAVVAPASDSSVEARRARFAGLRVLRATTDELAVHDAYLASLAKEIKGPVLWLAGAPAPSPALPPPAVPVEAEFEADEEEEVSVPAL